MNKEFNAPFHYGLEGRLPDKATHFIAVYSVNYISGGARISSKEYIESGVREVQHLKPFLKSVGKDIVAVFYVKLK